MVTVVGGYDGCGSRTSSLNVNAPEFDPKFSGVVGLLLIGGLELVGVGFVG